MNESQTPRDNPTVPYDQVGRVSKTEDAPAEPVTQQRKHGKSPASKPDLESQITSQPSAAQPPMDQLRRSQVPTARSRMLTYRVSALSQFMGTPSGLGVPHTVSLVKSDPSDEAAMDLYLDHHYIHPTNWTLAEDKSHLSWQAERDNDLHLGYVSFMPDGSQGFGTISVGKAHFSVALNLAPVSYTCALATDAGAYVTGGAGNVTLKWDSASPQWSKATWQQQALSFSYGLQSEIIVGQEDDHVAVTFQDLTNQQQWAPAQGAFSAILSPEFEFTFWLAEPDPHQITDTLFPFRLSFTFDPEATTFTGAMLTGSDDILGTVYALSGVVDNQSVIGLYALDLNDGRQTLVGVRAGQLIIDNQPHKASHIEGNTLYWDSLPEEAVAATGLPSQGQIDFSQDGERVLGGSAVSGGYRIHTLTQDLLGHPSLAAQPAMLRSASVLSTAASDLSTLGIKNLLNMSQFQKDDKGNWSDAIQHASMEDFYKIVQYYLSPNLRDQFFPDASTLDPSLKGIAVMQGVDGTQASDWYQKVGIAYLTSALSGTSDPWAKKLNAVRAQKWLRSEVARASVYQAQAPALYARRWREQWPDIEQFLSDQQSNQAKYVDLIQADVAQWKQQMQRSVQDAERLPDLLQTITDLATLGEQGHYWAYVFFRTITQPAELMMLQMMSLSGNVEGSAYTRRIQTHCAVLNLLDESGTFVQEYTKIIQLFQIGNILPTLLDYSGNIEEYQFAVQEILKAFIEMYGNSPDPAMAQAAQDLQYAMLHADFVKEVLEVFQGLATTFSGVYSWERLARTFEQRLPRLLPRIGSAAAKLVSLAISSAGIVSFYFGYMDWRSLDPEERAEVVSGAAAVFSEIAAAIVKRGIAYVDVFSTKGTVREALQAIWKTDLKDMLSRANTRLNNGFAKWLIREQPDEQFIQLAKELPFYEEEDTLTLTEKLFGRNLDEFVATRLGAMFATINLVLSSIMLSQAVNSGDSDEKAINSLFVASASLELIATVGSWALGAAGVETIVGFSVATIASAFGVLAGAAAIAGIVYLLVTLGKHQDPPPGPVQQFAENPAAQAGFYMPGEAEIDMLQIYAPSSGQSQLLGVALLRQDAPSFCVQLQRDGEFVLGTLTADYDTCFFLSTDAKGHAQLTTLVAGDTGQQTVLFTCTGNDGLSARPPITDDTRDQQQWAAEIHGGVEWTNDHHLLSADFALYNAYWWDTSAVKYYLCRDGQRVTVGPTPQVWTLKMVPTAPGNLRMDAVTIYTYQRDQRYLPYLGQRGSDLTWTITPSLPSFLTFDTKSGAIAQVPGEPPPVFAAQQYELTASNAVGSAKAQFRLQVLPPASQSRQ